MKLRYTTRLFATAVTVLFIFFGVICASAQGGLEEGLALKYIVQVPKQMTKHTPVIILLHGYGSDEKDLFELRSKFPVTYLVVSARAPIQLPNGGYEWYEFKTTGDQRISRKDQLSSSRMLIQKFVTQIVTRYNTDPKQVYLIGFSQGAIMCYEAGLTAPEEVKGIAVLSGRLDPFVRRGMTHMDEVKRMKIFIGHGTADERIKFEDGKAAYDFLKTLGLEPEFHEYAGMGHGIGPDELNDLVKWLR